MNFWQNSLKEIISQKFKLSDMILLSKVRTAIQTVLKMSLIKSYVYIY